MTTDVNDVIELDDVLVAQRVRSWPSSRTRVEAGVEGDFEHALLAVTLHQQGHTGRACAEAFFDHKAAG